MKQIALRHIRPGETGVTRGEMIENAITLAEHPDWANHVQRGEFVDDLAKLVEENAPAVDRARGRLEAKAKASRLPIPFAKPKARQGFEHLRPSDVAASLDPDKGAT